ncbi:LAME_0F16534g1_1 [Lachancea meyersii CBS 8951]|uniref:LAME_0F16534g1_1 n=1 Tax=Lachancea meyersii CBS 8951 TaxID=1266667 RepID=A0A1G4JZ98_9SACH|nr:LAME_0F16534g1_1 [Lachancea meyersii CBS 8951]
MDSSSINQSNLPSYEYRLASESRVARINEIYNKNHKRITNKHRDSIISDNSTSVLSNTQNDLHSEDNCQPVVNLQYKPQAAVEKPELPFEQTATRTVKAESEFNPFRPRFTEARPRSKDEMEQELHFTPKLRTRRSIIFSRTPGHDTPIRDEPFQFLNPKKRRLSNLRTESSSLKTREGLKELKARLGKPLPLGYLASSRQRNDETAAPSSQRKALESRWKRILSSAESEKPKGWNTSWHRARSPSNQDSTQLHLSDSETSLLKLLSDDDNRAEDEGDASKPVREGQLKTIKESLQTNNEKLEQILAILNDKKQFSSKGEATAWVICIIILIGLNLYLSNM